MPDTGISFRERFANFTSSMKSRVATHFGDADGKFPKWARSSANRKNLTRRDYAIMGTLALVPLAALLIFHGVLLPSSNMYSSFGGAFDSSKLGRLAVSLMHTIGASTFLLAGTSPLITVACSYMNMNKKVMLGLQLLIALLPLFASAFLFHRLLGSLVFNTLGRNLVAAIAHGIIPVTILYTVHHIYYTKEADQVSPLAYLVRTGTLLAGVAAVSLFGLLLTRSLFVPSFMFFSGAFSLLNALTLMTSLKLSDWVNRNDSPEHFQGLKRNNPTTTDGSKSNVVFGPPISMLITYITTFILLVLAFKVCGMKMFNASMSGSTTNEMLVSQF